MRLYRRGGRVRVRRFGFSFLRVRMKEGEVFRFLGRWRGKEGSRDQGIQGNIEHQLSRFLLLLGARVCAVKRPERVDAHPQAREEEEEECAKACRRQGGSGGGNNSIATQW
jgi:hypothetical protein